MSQQFVAQELFGVPTPNSAPGAFENQDFMSTTPLSTIPSGQIPPRHHHPPLNNFQQATMNPPISGVNNSGPGNTIPPNQLPPPMRTQNRQTPPFTNNIPRESPIIQNVPAVPLKNINQQAQEQPQIEKIQSPSLVPSAFNNPFLGNTGAMNASPVHSVGLPPSSISQEMPQNPAFNPLHKQMPGMTGSPSTLNGDLQHTRLTNVNPNTANSQFAKTIEPQPMSNIKPLPQIPSPQTNPNQSPSFPTPKPSPDSPLIIEKVPQQPGVYYKDSPTPVMDFQKPLPPNNHNMNPNINPISQNQHMIASQQPTPIPFQRPPMPAMNPEHPKQPTQFVPSTVPNKGPINENQHNRPPMMYQYQQSPPNSQFPAQNLQSATPPIGNTQQGMRQNIEAVANGPTVQQQMNGPSTIPTQNGLSPQGDRPPLTANSNMFPSPPPPPQHQQQQQQISSNPAITRPGMPSNFMPPPPPQLGQQAGMNTTPNQVMQPNRMPPYGQLRQNISNTPQGPQLPMAGTQYSPNHLANQMQGMHLVGGNRQYPQYASPPAQQPPHLQSTSGITNGTGYGAQPPHMPPPLVQSQQQSPLMNGQQMPSYPASNNMQPPYGMSYPSAASYDSQQQKKLDPDQMPSPIQVIEDDRRNRSGVFVTNQKGLVPPLVTTKFVVQDQGNCSPRFIRSTMYNVPITQDIMKQVAVPFSLVISPMAIPAEGEYAPPIVDFGELGPVRCVRCKAYMCPFMQFIDSGRRFHCLFCKATTDVPSEYFQHLDHTGQRMDRFERPELVLGTYEFLATKDYCRQNTLPNPPAFIFVLDVSYNSVKSGLVNLLCDQMRDILKHLPIDQGQSKSCVKIGFITYSNSVHFYNVKSSLAAPQMLIVGDTQEMFMPLLDGFLCSPEEASHVIDALMREIPVMFAETKETETVLLPAILAGMEALKASDCSGKLLVFHTSLPTAEAPGKLKNRDDRKLLGTDKERTVLTPQTQAYNQLGQDCVGAGCSVDLFLFNNAYIDIATIGQVSRLTGGEIHKYTYFQADIDGDRVIADVISDISRPIGFDAIMRVRTSTGIRPTEFYGHFFMSNTTDIELASIDCNKAIAVEIKHDDKLGEDEGVYIQAALLYTSCSGQRRLRIMNLSLKTCSGMSDLYRSCDADTVINYLSKQATYKLLDNTPKAVKDHLIMSSAQMLATYRKNCASPSSAGQLILPECMKLVPLYVNCLLKSDAISGGSDMTLDDRSFAMQAIMTMDVATSVGHFYPRLIPIHNINPDHSTVDVPMNVRCTVDKMNEQGVYILENGIHMFLWIGLGVATEFTQHVFGVPSAIQADMDRVRLPELDNPLSLTVRNIIEKVRRQKNRCMRLTIVRQREKLEPVFKHFLVEDRGNDGSASYVDFLVHMHKEIRQLLS